MRQKDGDTVGDDNRQGCSGALGEVPVGLVGAAPAGEVGSLGQHLGPVDLLSAGQARRPRGDLLRQLLPPRDPHGQRIAVAEREVARGARGGEGRHPNCLKRGDRFAWRQRTHYAPISTRWMFAPRALSRS